MNNRRYTYVLSLISVVILTTLAIQVYWNYKNYLESRRQLVADVQISLDQSVEDYFTLQAQEETFGIFSLNGLTDGALDSITSRLDQGKSKNGFFDFNSIKTEDLTDVTIVPGATMDSLNKLETQAGIRVIDSISIDRLFVADAPFTAKDKAPRDLGKFLDFFEKSDGIPPTVDTVYYSPYPVEYTFKFKDSVTGRRVTREKTIYQPKEQYKDSLDDIEFHGSALRVDTLDLQASSSFRFPEKNTRMMALRNTTAQDSAAYELHKIAFDKSVKSLSTKIILSYQNDKIDTSSLSKIIAKSLNNKEIDLDYVVGTVEGDYKMKSVDDSARIRAMAQSALLTGDQQVFLEYTNLTGLVLRRNLTGIVLSLLLVGSVIFCLFYLLKIIQKQKELGEMKNDLISNITHEFKTPIATTAAALEGVQNFNASGDHEKTSRYLDMGQQQLKKLNGMVEKLLETATLDSNELELQKSQIDLVALTATIVDRWQSQTDKSITFTSTQPSATIVADSFHLENAINNLIDNAIKYGGEKVSIHLEQTAAMHKLVVSDSGTNLSPRDARLLFDKFYRVGTGARHNVKGFGIGLFYTRSIIEKHGGTITVEIKPTTTFKILLPHE
ncbi:MAG: HAMP domain-containing sensor histidine kinase [Nonlabens sp.]